jgi:hypothetical protein
VANLSTYAQNIFLKWLTQGVAPATPPNPIFVALFTGDPGQTGASEVSTSGTGYARVSVSTTTASAIFGGAHVAGAVPIANGTKQEVQNSATITFPSPTGTWGTCSFWGAFDAASSGNFLFGGALTSNIAPLSGGSAPSFAVGAASVDMQ